MPFPESQRVSFAANPLVEVICQLRFPAVLRISTEPPSSFQERIRSRYPLFKTKALQNFSMSFAGPDGVTQSPVFTSQNVIHEFTSEDSFWTVALSQEYFALTTRQYTDWQDFVSNLTEPLGALLDAYQPAFFSRVGLRYQDLISRTKLGIEEVPWSRLLKPEIAGLLSNADIEGSIAEIGTQSLIAIDTTGGRVRLQHGFARIPGDQEICYVIDCDFFTEIRTGVNDGLAILNTFNASAGHLFRWCISDKLHNALKPRPLG